MPPDLLEPRRRVLVVDDYRDGTDSLVLMLHTLGADAMGVYDGASALAAVESFRPDVVLLDIGLPDLTGHEVASRLRVRPEGRKLMLVALSGWDTEESRRESAAAGIDRHLVKPIDLSALQSLLREPQPPVP